MGNGIRQCYWSDVSSLVKAVRPEFASLIDTISPDSKHPIYKVSYSYGDTVLKNGIPYIPNKKNKIVPIDDGAISKKIKSDLYYKNNGFPLGMVLKKSYELFIESGDDTLPTLITKPGSIFSLWRKLDPDVTYHPSHLFSATAGARHLFMTPNVGDHFYHKNLVRDFKVDPQPPKRMCDHWHVFKKIAFSQKSDWRLELLYFPSVWVDSIKNNPDWHALHCLLLKDAWDSSVYERNQAFFEFAIFQVLREKNRTPNPYLVDTIKHLLSIILGSAPGFAPAIDDDAGPIGLIRDAYMSSYNVKYSATIMRPMHFNFLDKNKEPVYYSLSLPTTLRLALRESSRGLMGDIRDLKYLINLIMKAIVKRDGSNPDDTLKMIYEQVDFSFFHGQKDRSGEIELASAIPDKDLRFILPCDSSMRYSFSSNATFFKGCVRIS